MKVASNRAMYLREKAYAVTRLLLLFGVTLISFILIRMLDASHRKDFVFLEMVLIGLTIFSFAYYIFLGKFPFSLLRIRKFVLVILDILALTVSIVVMGPTGIYLLPLYILIVMENGVRFGLDYFYFSVLSSSVSWLFLIRYSEYWHTHSNTIIVFAITTFLIPFMYLKQLVSMHEKHEILHETLENTEIEANYDTLTKLPNRKHYNSFIKEIMKEKEFFALLFIDLNKFKSINDTYGHDVGDSVLKEVSRRLSESIGEEDMLARLGGDEFVIITRKRKVFLPKFVSQLEERTIGPFKTGNNIDVYIELSIGIAFYPDDSKSEIFLRQYADEAMYCAKKRADTYHVFYKEI